MPLNQILARLRDAEGESLACGISQEGVFAATLPAK